MQNKKQIPLNAIEFCQKIKRNVLFFVQKSRHNIVEIMNGKSTSFTVSSRIILICWARATGNSSKIWLTYIIDTPNNFFFLENALKKSTEYFLRFIFFI